MYNKVKYTILGLLLLGLFSCQDYLDEVPKSFAAPENFYKTKEDAISAVTSAYNALQNGNYAGSTVQYFTTDVQRTASWNTQGGLGSYSMDGDNASIFAMWQAYYKGINEINAALTHIPGIKMDEELKNQLLAEAKFIRSLFYFHAVRIWGDIPMPLTETASLENKDTQIKETPADKVYDQIMTDVQFAIDHLKEKGEVAKGRATVGAAKTFMSKIHLTLGSIQKRDGLGDGKVHFQKAAILAKEVIDSDQYSLVSYYPDVFMPYNKNHDEMIFDVAFISGGVDDQFRNDLGNNMGFQGPNHFGGAWDNVESTQYYHTMFENSDTVRGQWNSTHFRITGRNKLLTTVPEMNGFPWKIVKFRKFPVRTANYEHIFYQWDGHWPIFRYAEVLMIYAEALLEVNNQPTEEFFWAINQLRERARNVNIGEVWEDILPRVLTYDENILPDLTETDLPDYQSAFNYIMDERAREFGGEFKRWFDLVRWGKLVERINFLGTHVPAVRTRPEDNWVNLVVPNIREFHRLMPKPNPEIRANPNIKQNPGYN